MICQDLDVFPFPMTKEIEITIHRLGKRSNPPPHEWLICGHGDRINKSAETYPRGFELRIPSISYQNSVKHLLGHFVLLELHVMLF